MASEGKPANETCGRVRERDVLGDRLASWWTAGDWHAFYGACADDLSPRIQRDLVRRGLTVEDAEDCVIQALEKVVKRQQSRPTSVRDPQSFIWQTAVNLSKDVVKKKKLVERAREIHFEACGRVKVENARRAAVSPDPDAGAEYGDIPQQAAVVLTESLVDDVEADPSWVVPVVAAAVERLRPALRMVAKHMLIYGHKCSSTDAEADLGMKARTYRPNRSKALAQLKVLIPAVMVERGISPKLVAPPDLGFVDPADQSFDDDGGP